MFTIIKINSIVQELKKYFSQVYLVFYVNYLLSNELFDPFYSLLT